MSRLQVNREKGWTELIIDASCDYSKFYFAAEELQSNFSVQFCNKLDDFDSLYWDFLVDSNRLTLHYNIYFGLSIFPTKFENATEEENLAVLQIGQMLADKINTENKS